MLHIVFIVDILSVRQRLVSVCSHAGLNRLLGILDAVVEHLVKRFRLLFVCQSPEE